MCHYKSAPAENGNENIKRRGTTKKLQSTLVISKQGISEVEYYKSLLYIKAQTRFYGRPVPTRFLLNQLWTKENIIESENRKSNHCSHCRCADQNLDSIFTRCIKHIRNSRGTRDNLTMLKLNKRQPVLKRNKTRMKMYKALASVHENMIHYFWIHECNTDWLWPKTWFPVMTDRLNPRSFLDGLSLTKPFEHPLRKHTYSNILIILPPKNENFQIKNSDIFHISTQNIDCGYSFEPPRRGGSNEYPQSMFWAELRKIMYTPVNPSFTI